MVVSWNYLKCIIAVSWNYFHEFQAVSWNYLKYIMTFSWNCLKHIRAIFWNYLKFSLRKLGVFHLHARAISQINGWILKLSLNTEVVFRVSLGYTQRNLFEIFLLNQPEIRLYLLFSDWFRSKRKSVWIQISREMVNTIWFRFYLI